MDLHGLLSNYLRGSNRSGDRFISAFCPFHKGGGETKRSFMVNVETGIWWCYSCHEKGSLRQLFEMLGAGGPMFDEVIEYYKNAPEHSTYGRYLGINEPNPGVYLPEGMLGLYQYCPTSLIEAGFTPETLWHFEVGMDYQRRRITFPLRDIDGRLMGLAGRRIDAEEAAALGRFTVYTAKELDTPEVFDVDGERRPAKFYAKPHTSQLLWHAHELLERKQNGYQFDAIVLAEGYKGTMWIYQSGFQDVVSPFGSKLSLPYIQKEGGLEEVFRCQVDLLFMLGPKRIIFFYDNDPAGQEAVWGSMLDPRKGRLAEKLSDYFPVQVVRYPRPETKQPDNLSAHEALSAIQASW